MRSVFDPSGPVPAFADAVQARDLNRAASLLAHDVLLSVPPLHLTRYGTQEVLAAVTALLQGFGELRYDVRSRYLAPGAVTDEAMIIGRQTGYFLGAEPTRTVSSVAARVIIAHDSATVTSITVWPDLAALRAATAGLDRVIDLTRMAEAGGMVTALRATIPPTHSKVIFGSAREEPEAAVPALLGAGPIQPPGPAGASGGSGLRAAPKLPVPRSIRRRRAFAAGSSMLAASTAITIWVAMGAMNAPGGSAALTTATGISASSTAPAGGARKGGSNGSGGGSGGSSAGAGVQQDIAGENVNGAKSNAGDGANGSGANGDGVDGAGSTVAAVTPAGTSPTPLPTKLTLADNEVVLSSDLLFDTGSSRLTRKASAALTVLIRDARAQKRRGTVSVSGYTDDRGTTAYNLKLSKRRAHAVALALQAGLAGQGMRFVSHGFGEDPKHFVQPNTTSEGQQRNRRVTVTFPPPPR
jgi:outer membrane protein OmpA-like peptidoglycan-associated protein